MNDERSPLVTSAETSSLSDFPDLSLLYNTCKQNAAAVEKGDYLLDVAFRENYLRYNANNQIYHELTIHKYSAEISRSERSVTVASSSFREIAEVVPYYQALKTYRDFLIRCLKNNGYETKTDRDAFLDNAKLYGTTKETHLFDNDKYKWLNEVLLKEIGLRTPRLESADQSAIVDRLLTFATDYSWWGGAKQLSRDDFFVSPVLAILGKAASSGEIYAFIVRDCAADEALYSSSKNLRLIGSESERVSTSGIACDGRAKSGSNIMIYGAPGTGKSWFIENDLYRDAKLTRTVFHPEYSYFDFVGSYKPAPVYSKTDDSILDFNWVNANIPGLPSIDYRFVPGPFVEAIIEAYDNPSEEYCLVIDEINRAPASAVFGDMFQLLDRGEDRASEYKIEPQPELAKFLKTTGHSKLAADFRIPSNLSLAATMNNADLGVTYLDTAFKRRWSFTYIPVELNKNVTLKEPVQYAGSPVTLLEIFTAINERLDSLHVNEDRWIGPFFVSPREIKTRGTREALKKVAMYLWDDVFRNERGRFFASGVGSLATIERTLDEEDPLLLSEVIKSHQLNDQTDGDHSSPQQSD